MCVCGRGGGRVGGKYVEDRTGIGGHGGGQCVVQSTSTAAAITQLHYAPATYLVSCQLHTVHESGNLCSQHRVYSESEMGMKHYRNNYM